MTSKSVNMGWEGALVEPLGLCSQLATGDSSPSEVRTYCIVPAQGWRRGISRRVVKVVCVRASDPSVRRGVETAETKKSAQDENREVYGMRFDCRSSLTARCSCLWHGADIFGVGSGRGDDNDKSRRCFPSTPSLLTRFCDYFTEFGDQGYYYKRQSDVSLNWSSILYRLSRRLKGANCGSSGYVQKTTAR